MKKKLKPINMKKEHCPTCGCEVTIEGKTTKYYRPVEKPVAVAWPSENEYKDLERFCAVGFHETQAVRAFYKRLKPLATAIDLEDFLKWYKPNHKLFYYDEPSNIIAKYNEYKLTQTKGE